MQVRNLLTSSGRFDLNLFDLAVLKKALSA